jgi:hypothetical protein
VGNAGVNQWDVLGKVGAASLPGGVNPWTPPLSPPPHPDNDGAFEAEMFNDPGPSCFNEGWLRHCINSCRMQHFTGINWLSQFFAQFSGSDLPWQSTRDQGDVDANQQGIDNANKFGPQDSCVERCIGQWWEKLRNECCDLNPNFTKKSQECCRLEHAFENYNPGEV